MTWGLHPPLSWTRSGNLSARAGENLGLFGDARVRIEMAPINDFTRFADITRKVRTTVFSSFKIVRRNRHLSLTHRTDRAESVSPEGGEQPSSEISSGGGDIRPANAGFPRASSGDRGELSARRLTRKIPRARRHDDQRRRTFKGSVSVISYRCKNERRASYPFLFRLLFLFLVFFFSSLFVFFSSGRT